MHIEGVTGWEGKPVSEIIIAPSNRSFLEQFDTAFWPYPFPIYGDPARALYREMGHVSMAKTKLLLKAGKALLKGGSKTFLPSDEKQQNLVKKAMKTHDIYIQGGSWLFSESGEVTWCHIDTAPEDHATIDQLLGQMK
ncbi:MAG: AhpC/TSA family protein [Bacillota bacterium]